MKITHPFTIRILNRQQVHPLQAASNLSGDKMVEMNASTSLQYSEYLPVKNSSTVVATDLILPEKNTYFYLQLPEFLKIRKGARQETLRNTRNTLWMKVAWKEKRLDSQFARQFELALPPDVPLKSMKEALVLFAEQSLASQGMIVDLAIHETKASSEPDAPTLSRTAYLMCTTRTFVQGVFSTKNRDWNQFSQLYTWRQEWFSILTSFLPPPSDPHLSQETRDLLRFASQISSTTQSYQNQEASSFSSPASTVSSSTRSLYDDIDTRFTVLSDPEPAPRPARTMRL